MLADFLFNDTQTAIEFQPSLVVSHREAVDKLCESLGVYLMYGDDLVTVSKKPFATERVRAPKEATPPVLALRFLSDDVSIMEDLLEKYAKDVEEGEPTAEGIRCTGCSAVATIFPAHPWWYKAS